MRRPAPGGERVPGRAASPRRSRSARGHHGGAPPRRPPARAGMDEQRRVAALERLEHRAQALVAGRAGERARRPRTRPRSPSSRSAASAAGSGAAEADRGPARRTAPGSARDALVVGGEQRLGLAGGQRLDARAATDGATSTRSRPSASRERRAAVGIVVGEVDAAHSGSPRQAQRPAAGGRGRASAARDAATARAAAARARGAGGCRSACATGQNAEVKRFSEPLHKYATAGVRMSTPSTLDRWPEAPHDDPRARGVHGPLARRGELRAARHAGLGRDRAARPRGRRGARLRGRPDRARARRRRDRGRRAARRQPRRLLEPGARARRPARALRRRAQHARRRRRRRARARARARPAARRPARRRARRRADRPGQRRLGRRSPGRSRRSRSATRCPASRPPARWSSTTSAASSRASQHLSALGHRRITVLSWAVETSPDREAERAVAGSAAALGPRLPRRPLRLLAQRLAPARARAARRRRTARPRSCACPTRSPTASTPRAPSSGSRSPATSPSRASATTRSRGCSRRR